MSCTEAIHEKKDPAENLNSERIAQLRERLERSLREAAEIEVELSKADGTIREVPHYSVIEGRAHELGKQLSREVQQQQMKELTASHASTAKCPTCGTRCPVTLRQRSLKSVDGETELLEAVCDCPGCRRAFFPDARDAGF